MVAVPPATGPYPGCVPELTDGRVRLRAHTDGDVDRVVAMCTDPSTLAWTTVPRPYDADQAREFLGGFVPQHWADGTDLTWAVEADLGDGPVFAGNISLRPSAPADVGFALHPAARGHGVMSAAVRLVAAYAFELLGAPVLQWRCEAGNLASWRVAWACGFRWDGEQASALPRHDGSLVDAWRAVLRPGESMSEPTTRWLDSPVLPAGPFRLRPRTEADVPRIVEACSDERTQHWLVTMPSPYGPDDARAFLRRTELQASRGESVGWAVVDPVDDVLLASVGIFGLGRPMSPTEGEVGYWAHPDARGRGVVTAAVGALADWALTPAEDGGLGLHRLALGASWGNTASRRVAEANGFELVGHFRLDGVLRDGTLDDGAWYDRLAPGRRSQHHR